MIKLKNKTSVISAALAMALVACGGFVYTTVGGHVTGLSGTLVLANDANFSRTLSADGPFSFKVASNAAYKIRVAGQPNPVNCTIANGEGQMTSETPVSNVAVTCVPNVPVGGMINGLVVGTTITLSTTDNGYAQFTRTQAAVPALPALPDYSFVIPTYVVSGQAYDVTVVSQPVKQVCIVSNGTGTALNTNLPAAKNVVVNCEPGVPVGVSLTGLNSGVFVTLTNNAGVAKKEDNLTLVANTATPSITVFNKSLLDGGAYAVTVKTHPVGQECTVTNGTGTAVLLPALVPINVTVNCVNKTS